MDGVSAPRPWVYLLAGDPVLVLVTTGRTYETQLATITEPGDGVAAVDRALGLDVSFSCVVR